MGKIEFGFVYSETDSYLRVEKRKKAQVKAQKKNETDYFSKFIN